MNIQPAYRKTAAARLIADSPEPQATEASGVQAREERARSIDELVLAGNHEFGNLDEIDFAALRNNKELGQQTLQRVRQQVARFHPEGVSQAYQEDVRRVFDARYLQSHGLQLETHLDGAELSALRKYVQAEDCAPNVADAARGINAALRNGQEEVSSLIWSAELAIFAERGVSSHDFEAIYGDKDWKTVAAARDFADSHASSEGGKYLAVAQGQNLPELRESMAREMVKDRGFEGIEGLDIKTVRSLLADCDFEGPNTLATYQGAVNQAVAGGETNYFRLNRLGNEAILKELGVSEKLLKQLKPSKAELSKAYPEVEPKESAAIRTKVLRDLLAVLPESERMQAIGELEGGSADLINAEKYLSRHFAKRIRWFSEGQVSTMGVGAMRRASITSALAKLPEEVRGQVFRGSARGVVGRMEKAVEETFGVEIHRKAGKTPTDSPEYAETTEDWDVQGLADTYNALSAMSHNGKLPEGLAGNTTLAYMSGCKTKSPDMVPLKLRQEVEDPAAPFNRPGQWAHAAGKSGYYGEASNVGEGRDVVVLFDDALYDTNSVGVPGRTLGELTLVHELGHAIQLGGTPGAPEAERELQTQKNVAEWSSLAGWTEGDGKLADRKQGNYQYYYDPGVKVADRKTVVSSYGASDPIEDFAEYQPYFFTAPEVAMRVSAAKFLYVNQMMGQHYTPEQIESVARKVGLSLQDVAAAHGRMLAKVAAAPEQAGLA